ncbi:MAG TPA: hemerythrin domain-containing protein [Burkholderiaceae bacterium]|jgi:hemerythrin superfamily protein|nr:hemerythrin domain-containing protein [Burkholderiaceae bacterium]
MPHKPPSQSSSPDALDVLAEDHKKIFKMFAEFQEMKKGSGSRDQDTKQDLVERACAKLTIHRQIEEEIFYPALRVGLDDASILNEAEVEHEMAHWLIAELESMQPDDDLYDAKFTVLSEYVRHHIKEEEEKIFKKAKNSKLDLAQLGDELRSRMEELYGEFGLPEKNAEAVQDAHRHGGARRSSRERT